MGLDLDAHEAIKLAHAAGFGGVDLLVRDVVASGVDPRELRSEIDNLGLRPGAWPLPMNWKADAESFERDLRDLPSYARCASILGLTRTGTWVLPDVPAGSTFEETLEMHFKRLAAIAQRLDDFGIALGLEVIGVESSRRPGSEPFVHQLADLQREFKPLLEVNPNMGILLDGFHLHAAGENIEAGLAWGVDKIVWVHVADVPAGFLGERSRIIDRQRGLPGQSTLMSTKGLLQSLHDAGYKGAVTAEPFSECEALQEQTPIEAANRVAASMRFIWPT